MAGTEITKTLYVGGILAKHGEEGWYGLCPDTVTIWCRYTSFVVPAPSYIHVVSWLI